MKRLFLLTLLFFLTYASSALAHTGLESSSPQNGDIIKEELEQITLTFETKIEQGSTFELQNSSGETIPVENISLVENQLVGTFSNPLENGEYQVNWKIIGVDGHLIEGIVSFAVDVPVPEAPVEKQVETQEETQPRPKIEEKEVDPVNEENVAEVPQNKLPSYVLPIIIGVLIIIVVGSFLLMMKRKK